MNKKIEELRKQYVETPRKNKIKRDGLLRQIRKLEKEESNNES